jgi:hypothetical protein
LYGVAATLTGVVQLTAAQRHIVDSCARGFGTHAILSSLGSRVFVKRGNTSLKSEARTQAYLYAQVQSPTFALRVPEVYDVFSDGAGSTYLVMEHIPAPSFHAWINEPDLSAAERARRTTTAVDVIADTVAVLLRCPLPEGNGIGPIGGGCIRHSFFCMEDAPVPFVDAAALENFVNKVRWLLGSSHRPVPRTDLAIGLDASARPAPRSR